MATSITIEFFGEDGKIYSGKVINGKISLVSSLSDVNHSMFEADVKLQNWASFTLTGEINLFVIVKSGAKQIRTKRFKTHELVVTRGEFGHSLRCLVENLDLREYFGSIHEYSA